MCRDGCGTNPLQGVQHSAVLVFPAFGLVRLLARVDSTDRIMIIDVEELARVREAPMARSSRLAFSVLVDGMPVA